ncbi:MAG: hypothetical protein ACTSWN_03865, partial [Promethearchaeota archaeon]
MNLDLADMILRISTICILFICGAYVLLLAKKEEKIKSKKMFNVTFSFFFFFTGLNFLITEIDINYKLNHGEDSSILPNILDPGEDAGYNWFLGHPANYDFYMFTMIILSLIPMIFALEK